MLALENGAFALEYEPASMAYGAFSTETKSFSLETESFSKEDESVSFTNTIRTTAFLKNSNAFISRPTGTVKIDVFIAPASRPAALCHVGVVSKNLLPRPSAVAANGRHVGCRARRLGRVT
jgi:hypothetical protein